MKRAWNRKPYSCRFDFCYAAENIDGTADREDELIEAAKRLGFFFEGGATTEMTPAEVVPDSPLDRELRKQAG